MVAGTDMNGWYYSSHSVFLLISLNLLSWWYPIAIRLTKVLSQEDPMHKMAYFIITIRTC